MNDKPQACGSDSSTEFGMEPDRAAFEAWMNPGRHAGNVSPWVAPGRYEKDTHQLAWLAWRAASTAERRKWEAAQTQAQGVGYGMNPRQKRHTCELPGCASCGNPERSAFDTLPDDFETGDY